MQMRTLGSAVVCAAIGILAIQGKSAANCNEVNEVTVLSRCDGAQGFLPESSAVDGDGNLILSMSPQHSLWKFIPDGSQTLLPVATLPVPDGVSTVGVKIDDNGDILTCTATLNPTLPYAGVWRVTPSGEVSLVANLDSNGFPNDIAIDDDSTLFVTDPVLGVIHKITPSGETSVWLDDPQLSGDPEGPLVGAPWGANGIAFDRTHRFLYISNTDFGEIYRVHVRRDGSAGRVRLFASDPLLIGADGIAFDARGRLYVAVNTQNSVVRVNQAGHVTVIAEGEPFDGPSSIAFASDGLWGSEIYVTSFALGTALGGGIPMPSLESITVPVGGLPLP